MKKLKNLYLIACIATLLTLMINYIISNNVSVYATGTNMCSTTECEGEYENGFCTLNQSHYQVPQQISETHYSEFNSTHNGYYAITNAGELFWFASQVDSGNNAINGLLINNIIVNEGDVAGCNGVKDESWIQWNPIGDYNYSYTGNFDGNNHYVSGLYHSNGSTQRCGLFGATDKATIKNVGVENFYFYADRYTGGIVGNLMISTISNCYAINGQIFVQSYNSGGLFGGFNSISTVSNCYVSVNVHSYYDENNMDAIISKHNSNVTFKDVFYNSDVASTSITADGIYSITSSQIASGEAAYIMNEQINEQIWYQQLDTANTYPRLSGLFVYKENDKYVNKYNHDVDGCCFDVKNPIDTYLKKAATCLESAKYYYACRGCDKYSTDNYYSYGDPNGHSGGTATCTSLAQCEVCGESYGELKEHSMKMKINKSVHISYCENCDLEAVEIHDYTASTCECGLIIDGITQITNENYMNYSNKLNNPSDYIGYYAIEDVHDLYWFTIMSNDASLDYNQSNVVLLNDIVVNEGTSTQIPWIPIAQTGSTADCWGGTFDGNYHTISGLYYHNPASTSKYVGFIGYMYYGEIKNLGIINSYFYAYKEVGAVAGRTTYGSVENCYNQSEVRVVVDAAGGVVGCSYFTEITTCYNVGNITYDDVYVSGTRHIGSLVGYNLDSVLRGNCYLDTTFYCGIDTVDHDEIYKYTIDDFKSGKATFYLNSVFGQNLDNGKDVEIYPSFTGAKVYYGCTSCAAPVNIFSNNKVYLVHAPDWVDGICSKCNRYQDASIIEDSNDIYYGYY